MGNVFKRLFGNKEMRVLMLGLDSAGKTSESRSRVSTPSPSLSPVHGHMCVRR